MTASLLAGVQMAPGDPILGVTETFVADTHPEKVNLGVGVYYDDNGKVPLLECVRRAEQQRMQTSPHRGYLPIDGLAVFDRAVQELVFTAGSPAVAEKRTVTVQALGGTGGLKVGADFLRRFAPGAEIWISDPSWENHRQLFEQAGFKVNVYPYYDPATHGLDFAGMKRALEAMPAGSIVVLHACCHNPTGVDLSQAEWRETLEVVQARGLVPFLDFAYQGFGEGADEDAYAVRLFAQAMTPVFVSSSFSKSFSLYGERAGALSVVASDSEEAARVLSQLKRVVRANYSNPPTHGGQVVATVLTSPELRGLWEKELGAMRDRIKAMRKALVEKVEQYAPEARLDFILRQNGMFSYSGLTKAQVLKLRSEHSIYAIETGRICVAALNSKNVDRVAQAIAAVMKT